MLYASDLVVFVFITANPRPARGTGGKPSDEPPRGKNKFSLAKWFGFGPK
jgi:hypothetical protein